MVEETLGLQKYREEISLLMMLMMSGEEHLFFSLSSSSSSSPSPSLWSQKIQSSL